MRRAVGVLRDDTAAPEVAPLPTLTQLDALLVHAKGERARIAVEGSPRVLPPASSCPPTASSSTCSRRSRTPRTWTSPSASRRTRWSLPSPARHDRAARAAIERARERARLHSGTVEATVRGGRAEAFVSLPVVAVVPGP